VAPALHSFTIPRGCGTAQILGTLFDCHVDLRKLILKGRRVPEDDCADVLTKIVALYPELEALTLDSCFSLRFVPNSLIPSLKKLSELNLTNCQVIKCLLNC
jgi:hypothetical protein